MEVFPLKTFLLKEKFDFLKIFRNALLRAKIILQEGDILLISSKIVALSQGRVVDLKAVKPSKRAKSLKKIRFGRRGEDPRIIELVLKEADKIFQGPQLLTLKNNILIPTAGIDRSNVPKGFVILWPKDPEKTVHSLWKTLRKKLHIKKLGIVLCDSHCQPLRWGTTGIALAWAGFEGIEDIRGEKDIYGKPLLVTRKAVADNLASTTLLLMGEANEKIPLVLIRGAPVKFTTRLQKKSEIFVKPKQCLFKGIYNKNIL